LSLRDAHNDAELLWSASLRLALWIVAVSATQLRTLK
jgi:hypothetical protein